MSLNRWFFCLSIFPSISFSLDGKNFNLPYKFIINVSLLYWGRNVFGHNFVIKTLIHFIIKNLKLKLDAECEKMVKTNAILVSSIKKFPNFLKMFDFPLFNQFLLSKKLVSGKMSSISRVSSIQHVFYIQVSL